MTLPRRSTTNGAHPRAGLGPHEQGAAAASWWVGVSREQWSAKLNERAALRGESDPMAKPIHKIAKTVRRS